MTDSSEMPVWTGKTAARLVQLALNCARRPYPNKIAHVLQSDADAKPPRELTPAFYGCFDWHSAVHAHWTIARVAHQFPNAGFAAECRMVLHENLTVEHIEVETAYLKARPGFERPYGLAWLLALGAELQESDLVRGGILDPLEEVAVEQVCSWLEKLPRPDRSGQHPNTAFALGLMLDAARATGHAFFEEVLVQRARDFYRNDRNAPVDWEPGGEDFLSPALAEADLMRRILDTGDFADWLDGFLPDPLPLELITSPDPADGKLAHLDGLNLSRAWMLQAIAQALPEPDARRERLLELGKAHAAKGLAAVTGEHYAGSHWLATFAVYLLSLRVNTW